VAVTIDKKADGKSWTPEEMKNFESLVTAAVGSALYQGGAQSSMAAQNVTVKEMNFFKSEKIEYKESPLEKLGNGFNTLSSSPIVRPAAGLLLLGVLFLVFKKYFAKGAEGNETASASAVFSEEVRQLPTEAGLDKPNSDLAPIMDALQAKAAASPQTVAALMENWLSQDQGA
jgi:flagellar biosynthesis/type III secretory pathway M-ring protein FliF/YscJ